jgi:hypothetical protein
MYHFVMARKAETLIHGGEEAAEFFFFFYM